MTRKCFNCPREAVYRLAASNSMVCEICSSLSPAMKIRIEPSIGQPHPDTLPEHPAHTIDLSSGNTGGVFDPQETVFEMRDGCILTFYPDAPPTRRGTAWLFHIDNNCEAHYIMADAVKRMSTQRQETKTQ